MRGGVRSACFLGQLAEGERAPAVDHEPVAGFTFAWAQVPAIGGRSDQHHSRDGRGLAQRLFECPHRRRVGGDSNAVRPAFLLRQRVGVGFQQRRGLDSDRLPGCAKLIGHDLRQRGPDSLARFHLRHGHRDPPVACDLDEIPERLFAGPDRQVAAKMVRPQGKGHDESDAYASADQQCPAIEVQRA